jgi:hypothetical protein
MTKTKAKKSESTLEMWAADLLMEAKAIAPCPDHGYLRLHHSHQAINYALALAEHRKFRGKNKEERLAAVERVLDGLSDECPAC